MRLTLRLAHLAVVPLLALTVAGVARAQSAPAPAPAPTPIVFAAHAHANVTVTTKAMTYAITAQVALANRDRYFRVDLLSVRSQTLPIPSATLTFVVDRVANTVTVWNEARSSYYVQSLVPALPGIAPAPSASAAPTARSLSGRSPLADLDVFAINIALGNHGTTSGLATTGLTMTFDIRKKGGAATSHLTSSIQLADDFAAFPVSIDATVDPGTGDFGGTFTYAIDDFARSVPPGTTFTVPSGYTPADSLLAVLLGRAPKRPATH